MTSLAYIPLWIFVFSLPWERLLVLPGVAIIARVTGALALSLALLAVVVTGRFRRWHVFHFAALLFWLWAGLTLFIYHSGERLPAKYWTYGQLLLVVWMIWEIAPTVRRQRGLLTAYVFGAYIAAFGTIMLYRREAGALRRFAVGGADPNDLAMVLALSIPMAWYLAMTYTQPLLKWACRAYLPIGIVSGLITTIVATILGLLAGYYRGWVDAVIARTLDVIWSLPVLLFGIALGVSLAVGGLKIGPLELSGGSIWVPIFVICVFTVPYMARPLRGEVLALSEKEFVEAAVAQGAGPRRVMFAEILPNLASTIIVFFTLNVANNMLFEAALSFLGAGVQPPNSSWGSMISIGEELLTTQPLLALIPGTMILLTVLSLNIVGDGLRDALDPRSKVRLEAHAGTAEPEGASV